MTTRNDGLIDLDGKTFFAEVKFRNKLFQAGGLVESAVFAIDYNFHQANIVHDYTIIK